MKPEPKQPSLVAKRIMEYTDLASEYRWLRVLNDMDAMERTLAEIRDLPEIAGKKEV